MGAAGAVQQTEDAFRAASQPADGPVVNLTANLDYDKLADAIVAATERAERQRSAEEAELAALLAEADKLVADTTGTEGV